MANRTSLKDCHDDAGNFDPVKYVQYVNQRDEKLDEDEAIPKDVSKKGPTWRELLMGTTLKTL